MRTQLEVPWDDAPRALVQLVQSPGDDVTRVVREPEPSPAEAMLVLLLSPFVVFVLVAGVLWLRGRPLPLDPRWLLAWAVLLAGVPLLVQARCRAQQAAARRQAGEDALGLWVSDSVVLARIELDRISCMPRDAIVSLRLLPWHRARSVDVLAVELCDRDGTAWNIDVEGFVLSELVAALRAAAPTCPLSIPPALAHLRAELGA